MKLIFLNPIPRRTIWGQNKIGEYFGYKNFPSDTGQCWGASCHSEASNLVLNGSYQGMTLSHLWDEHPELFGHPKGKFPWIVGLVGPSDDLSIQVHPDNSYTKSHHLKDCGKNEGWYFIDTAQNSSIVYGHTAKTLAEFKDKMDNNQWDKLLLKKDVHKDDFVYLPAKTIHALCKGSIVYEIQQNSNLTYRLYDYNRKNPDGTERELHINESLANLTIPHAEEPCKATVLQSGQNTIRGLICNPSFELTLFDLHEAMQYPFKSSYGILSILGGSGTINEYSVALGDHILVPCGTESLDMSGSMKIILVTLPQEI